MAAEERGHLLRPEDRAQGLSRPPDDAPGEMRAEERGRDKNGFLVEICTPPPTQG
jgi:hypothetical protein